MSGQAGGVEAPGLVVADVDGTLVDKGGPIPEEVMSAIAAFRAGGGLFTLATGRPLGGARVYVDALGLDLPVIVFNGALVYDYGRQRALYQHTLAREVALRAVELAADHPVDVFLYLGAEILVRELSPRVMAYMRKDHVECRPVGDLAAFLDHSELSPPKLLFYGPVGDSLELMRRLGAICGEVNYVQSDAEFIELLPPGVSKGKALAWLAEYLDVPLARVVAIGDHHNDIELLRCAGVGVAVANAQPELKERATWVTRASHGLGVAEVLAESGQFTGLFGHPIS